MTKTNKIFYGGFAVVALAGIVAMLVYVFSPPMQIVEETVETPKIEVGTAKSIEDAPNQMEQWRQDVANARMQREANEAWANLIQAEKDTE